MATYRYRAMTQGGKVVSGSIAAATQAEVMRRIEYLGMMPIDASPEDGAGSQFTPRAVRSRAKAEDVKAFTRDLGLLLRSGVRLDDALELLAADADIARLRPVIMAIRSAVLSGETFAEALSKHPTLFPSLYVALARAAESSNTLPSILDALAEERSRAEAVRRRIADALSYPIFVLLAAGAVLVFFVGYVLPQFVSVLRDFNAETSLLIEAFIVLSDVLRFHGRELAGGLLVLLAAGWAVWRRPTARARLLGRLAEMPGLSTIAEFHRTALFCRNLGLLLGNGVTLPAALRILIDIMAPSGRASAWEAMSDRVRRGGKLSDALGDEALLPAAARRMLRLGEETGQLPSLASQVAGFYDAKLQRRLDRIVGVVGPAAIVIISFVVGGLIVSVMTALMSVSQIVG